MKPTSSKRLACLGSVATGVVLAIVAGLPALAQDAFNPFDNSTGAAPPRQAEEPRSTDSRKPLAPMDGVPPNSRYAPPIGQQTGDPGIDGDGPPQGSIDKMGESVERGELAPVMAEDGSGLPYELWQGLSAQQFEVHVAALDIPPRSAALHDLWRRLITSGGVGPATTAADARFMQIRIDALEKSGLIAEAADMLSKDLAGASNPLLATLLARSEIELGNRDRGCELARGLAAQSAAMPASLKGEAILISGYCAAVAGNMEAASLQASLAREIGLTTAGPDVLDAVASGATPQIAKGRKLSLLDYRILELKGAADPATVAGHATPALSAALALTPGLDPNLKLASAEAAAAVNAIAPVDLAAIYRAANASGASGPAQTRAALFKAAESERTPLKKARAIRAFLDDARRAGLYWTALFLMAQPAQSLERVSEIGWFAETAVEASLAAGDFERARAWADFGTSLDQYAAAGGLSHWRALADIADATVTGSRAVDLAAVEQMARHGRFNPVVLHRLVTVLEALDINVPIPLWDLANRTPQPTAGQLPETGILSELEDAAKKREFGRTALLAMRTLGPEGPEGAHMIALRDAIRALNRSGLKQEAHRLALEGLFTSWPRSVTN